ncbi:MAG: hypothetical protein EBT43_04820 [Methylocystaceae bacterium]|nr:hypothetical protein [Methylocystaceae bacterium]
MRQLKLARDLYTNDIRERLLDNIVELFNYFTGKIPSKRNRSQTFWGKKGSLRVNVYGDRRGLWIDREAGVGGDIFKAINHYAGVSGFGAQVEWAADWLGVPQFDPGAASQIDRDQVAAKLAETKRLAEERAKRLADEEALYAIKLRKFAQAQWGRSSSIDATPGEIYLKQTRQIPIANYPSSVRWHSDRQALAFAISDRDGSIKTIQFVAVTPEGLKDSERLWNSNNPDDKRAKHTLGPIGDEGALRLAGPKDGPLVVAEGPETALSTWAAGFDTIATIGPITINKLIANIERDRKIIIAFDDDPVKGGVNPKREFDRKRMIRKLQRDGYDVAAVKPFEIRREKKQDFNDLLQEQGVNAVRARINSYAQPKIADLNFMGALEARQKLDPIIEANMHSMALWERKDDSEFAPAICLKVTAGVGKTAAYIRAIKPILRAMRARGDMRSIAISLPFHDLGDDVRERYHNVYKPFDAAIEEAQAEAGAEFRIAGYRGREAKRHRSEELMCGNIEDVRIAHKRRVQDITKEICQAECSLRDSCPYLAQRDHTADIWLISHSRLFAKMPAPISKTQVAMVIADETAWRPALDIPDVLIPVRDIEDMPLGDGQLDEIERFAEIRSRIIAAALANGEGPLKTQHIVDTGLSVESADFAINREYMRITDEGPWRERIVNETVGSMLRLWQSLKELLTSNKSESGWLRVERDDANKIVLRVRGAMKVSKDWRVPTLHVDASIDVSMLRHFWPGLVDGGSFDVDVAHTKIYQVIDSSFAKSKFEPLYGEIKDDKGAKIQKERAEARRRLRAFIAKVHRKHSSETLVITNKRVKEALDISDIPGVTTGHFNAIAGKDGWGNVSAAIIIGRTQPPIDEVTRMAEALSGDVIEPGDHYSRRDGIRISRQDGELIETRCEVEFHPHPIAERIRHRICEGEIYQSLHRARPVNRTARDPVTIYLLNDLAIDIPVDGFIDADRIRYPSPRDLMLAEGGVAFATAASASLAYPHIWATPGHLRKVMFMRRRAEEERGVIGAISVTSTYNKLSIGAGNAVPEIADGLIRVRFQRQGPKLHREEAYYDPRRVEDPRAAIEAMVGPLSWFEGPEIKTDDETEIAALPMAVGSDLAPQISQPIVVRIEERAKAQSFAGAIVLGVMAAIEAPDGVGIPANDFEETGEDKIHIPADLWAQVWMTASDSAHSHEHVAERCNVSLAHLSNIEAGRRSGTAELLAGLERYVASANPIQGRLL